MSGIEGPVPAETESGGPILLYAWEEGKPVACLLMLDQLIVPASRRRVFDRDPETAIIFYD
jgi:hypothetical protein